MNATKLSVILLLLACLVSARLQAQKKKSDMPLFTVTSPAVYTYYKDSIHYDFSIRINKECVSKRNRIVVAPSICVIYKQQKDTLDLAPIVIEGKLYHNLRLRNGNIDKYDSLAILPDSSTMSIRRISGYIPSDKHMHILSTYIASHEMSCCNQYWAPVASLDQTIRDFGGDHIILPPVDKEIRNEKEAISENIKWRKVSGKAYLNFKINEYKIDLKIGNNLAQIQEMTQTFRKVITDPYARFDSAFIKGQSSPDGNYEFNDKLAVKRSQDALRFLKHELDSLKLPYKQSQFRTSYLPEAWDELYEKIAAAPRVPDKEKVLDIIRNTKDINARKYLLKRMKNSFAFLRDSILGNIRRVDYAFYFTFKDLTADEQRELLHMRPDVYVPADFLAVERSTTDDAKKIDILHIAFKQYPDNTHILQNLLAEYIRQKQWEAATMLADSIDIDHHCFLESGFMRNYTLLCLHNEAYDKFRRLSTRLLSRRNEMTDDLRKEIHYGLGLVALKQYQFQEAYRYLEPFKDQNTVLALRGLGLDLEAQKLSETPTNTNILK